MTEQIRNNRLVLATIIGLPLTMILAATWLWWFVVRGDLDLVGMLGTANSGTLVQPPRQLADYRLIDADGYEFVRSEQEPKWTLLVPVNETGCDNACEQGLYVSRQIHVAMGKEFARINRYLVAPAAPAQMTLDVLQLSDASPAPDSFEAYLENEHRGLEALQLSADSIAELFPENATDASTWYLVDPGGWVMMSYTAGTHYKDVISDLKFLLKNSGN